MPGLAPDDAGPVNCSASVLAEDIAIESTTLAGTAATPASPRPRSEGCRPFAQRMATPLLTPELFPEVGSNINGPSLIRAPEWLDNRLGTYYLYFAHHDGHYIRLAYADQLQGPWHIHQGGVLSLPQSRFAGHIASPDVHVDNDARQIRLYFHGAETPTNLTTPQLTRVAVAADGLAFVTAPHDIGLPYMRVFEYNGWYYGIAMPGVLYRSRDGLTDFDRGPDLLHGHIRHCAVLRREHRLHVFYTNVGDCPEHIRYLCVALQDDWQRWDVGMSTSVLQPMLDWEGADCPLVASQLGMVDERVHALRDPAVFSEDGVDWLLYSIAGESGIALARLGWR